MQALRICFGLLAFAALAAMGVAVAANLTSSRLQRFRLFGIAPEFYVWCAGSGSRTVYQNGLSAGDAQDKPLCQLKMPNGR